VIIITHDNVNCFSFLGYDNVNQNHVMFGFFVGGGFVNDVELCSNFYKPWERRI
jgi:hypothetical protein